MISHVWSTFLEDIDLSNYQLEGIAMASEGLEGLSMPAFDYYTTDAPLLDGQTFQGWRAQPRDVFWPIVLGTTQFVAWQDAQTLFWRTLRPGVYGKWIVTNTAADGTVLSVRNLAVRFEEHSTPTYDIDPSMGEVELVGVTLTADDPWWRGDTVSETFSAAGGIVPFYATSGGVLNLMPSNSIGSASIDNFGEIEVWPVFEIFGPISAFSISTFGAVNPSIAGVIEVDAGQVLTIDTNPTKKLATLYDPTSGNTYNVTRELSDVDFFQIPADSSMPIDVTLNGPGSLTVSIVPGYYRAF